MVKYKDVEGIYITRIPGVGQVLNELSKPTTMIIVILGITIIFILLFSISNKKIRKKEREEYMQYLKEKEKNKYNFF